MKTRVQPAHLALLPERQERRNADGEFGEAFVPAALLLVIALIRLAAFAWHPVSWGVEESIALAFALAAGFLLIQFLPRSQSGSRD
jgi:hypothetical protein